MAGLFAKKPLERLLAEGQEVGEHSLKRSLGPVNLVMLGIEQSSARVCLCELPRRSPIVRALPSCSRSSSQESAAHLPACVTPNLRR